MGGVVKALVNTGARRLLHHSDSDLQALQPPVAHTRSVSEQRLSHHGEQLAMLLPVHSKAIAEYLCLLAKEDQMWGTQDSLLYKGVCLKSVFPLSLPHKAGRKLEM